MENKTNERVIYLKDLFFCVLYKWRAILITVLVFALLLGGYKAVTSLSNIGIIVEPSQQQIKAYEDEQARLSLRRNALEHAIVNQHAFMENAIVMQVNAYDHCQLTLQYHVDAGYQIQPGASFQNPDPAVSLLDAYRSSLLHGSAIEAIGQTIGLNAAFLSGAVDISTQTDSNVLVIRFIANSEEAAQTVQPVIEQQMKALHAQLSASLAPHTLTLLETVMTTQADQNIANTQKSQIDQLGALQADLAEVNTQLDALQQPVGYSSGDLRSVVKTSVIFAVIGGMLAVFLGVVFLWIGHISSTKVYSGRTLADRTGVKVLGALADRIPHNPIDKKLQHWEGRQLRDPQQQAELLAINIRALSKDTKTLLLTGSTDPQTREALAQALRSSGMQVENAQDILSSADALQTLGRCDAVVLVEQCHASRYTDVNRRAELIADYGKQLTGCVLLGG